MSAFVARVAALAGVAEDRLQRLHGGDLSEVLMIPGGLVAKGGPAVPTEAAMLRALHAAGAPAPGIEGEYQDVLLLQHIDNDGVMSPRAWGDIGRALRDLHDHRGETYGWPANYRLGTVELDNRENGDWPAFWGEQRLAHTAAILDRPWRERVAALLPRLVDLLPPSPLAALLHGDLWGGNILVKDGALAAFIDPACYYGHVEVDLAMLHLFDAPPEDFHEAYGPLEPGWEERRLAYQLFPALVHFRLFGATYAPMVDRLLSALGV
ncbi:fructosamine kinase family protein [Allosphingosinicella vermicomposti]|uniref:fructosamine kinase family protein n=1 Tax=Allosphingosinicella vermicomposti TaxID=614671 RepID=UPI0018F8A1C8|nr:fructosamine kinase family protein [Allosphingosinicella vermicomposti]